MDYSLASAIESAANAPFVTVEACKYDQTVHRRWQAQQFAETKEYWGLIGKFEQTIRHPLLGVIRPGTWSLEFYWKNRCYNVFRFHEPDGLLRNFYCNINLPPVFDGQLLSYVDLDADVLVEPSLAYQVVDLDEFAANAALHNYPPKVHRQAAQGLNELRQLIEERRFPFNYQD